MGRYRLLARCLIVVAGAALSGCGTAARVHPAGQWHGSEERLAQVRRSVVRFNSSTVAGSAVSIGDGRLLTCRHVLPERVRVAARLGAAATAGVAIDGRPVRIRLVASGESDRPEDDWAVVEVVSGRLDAPPATLDPDRPLAIGDAALMIGYWGGPDDEPSGGRDRRRQWVVRTSVRGVPFPWTSSEDLILMDGPSNTFNGMSGGAAVVWDDRLGNYVVVGVYFGYQRWQVLGVTAGRSLTARRVPAGLP